MGLHPRPAAHDPRRRRRRIRGVWDHDDCERFADRMQERFERLAPGFGSRVLARRILGPRELEARNANLIGGAVGGGTVRAPPAAGPPARPGPRPRRDRHRRALPRLRLRPPRRRRPRRLRRQRRQGGPAPRPRHPHRPLEDLVTHAPTTTRTSPGHESMAFGPLEIRFDAPGPAAAAVDGGPVAVGGPVALRRRPTVPCSSCAPAPARSGCSRSPSRRGRWCASTSTRSRAPSPGCNADAAGLGDLVEVREGRIDEVLRAARGLRPRRRRPAVGAPRRHRPLPRGPAARHRRWRRRPRGRVGLRRGRLRATCSPAARRSSSSAPPTRPR